MQKDQSRVEDHRSTIVLAYKNLLTGYDASLDALVKTGLSEVQANNLLLAN